MLSSLEPIKIEFVSDISDKLFSIRFFGKNNLYKITTNGEKLPNWLTFYANDKDREKLNEFGFSEKLITSIEGKTIKNYNSRDNFKILRILILLVSLTIATIAILLPFWSKYFWLK